VATGLTGNVEFVAFAAGFAINKSPQSTDVGHLKDITKEPAYGLGGIVLGLGLGAAYRLL
jgi:hypothetical protein